MLAQGEQWMIPALSELWHICFEDDPDYIRFFMENRFRPVDTLVWLEGDEPVGVAYLIPCQIGHRGARYGYAIGVLPSWRRRGVGRRLLSGAKALCQREDALLFVAPRPGVEGYYHALGFQDGFYYRTQRYTPQGTWQSLSITDAAPQRYWALREAVFSGPGDVRWDCSAVSYALAEQRRCGGFAHILTWEGCDYLLFGAMHQETLCLRETTLPAALLCQLAFSLCRYYHASCIQCEIPSDPGSGCRARGCCFPHAPSASGWLGLDLT